MKKILLVLVMVASFSGVYGQNKTQEKKINYFVDAAAKEFSLDSDQKKELLEARHAYISDFMAVQKDSKSGTISDEEKKEKMNKVNSSFMAVLAKITGKTPKDLQPFLGRMRDELKNV